MFFFFLVKTLLTEESLHIPLPSRLPEIGYLFSCTTANTWLSYFALVELLCLLKVAVTAQHSADIPFLFGFVFVSKFPITYGTMYRFSAEPSHIYILDETDVSKSDSNHSVMYLEFRVGITLIAM